MFTVSNGGLCCSPVTRFALFSRKEYAIEQEWDTNGHRFDAGHKRRPLGHHSQAYGVQY